MADVEASPAGLPPDALRRLQELEPTEGKPGLFTSDLSVNEFLLIRQAGFRPRGLVFGSSIYHIGLQGRSWRKNQELKQLSEAMYSARQLAMERMETEADILGADGIVGVRLQANFYDWGKHSAEFIAIGTAVSTEGSDGSWRTAEGKPFTSDLSGQDFWTVLQTGYAPVGLVMGTCVYHVAHRGLTQAATQVTANRELDQFTQALYEARELAMERMQEEAITMGAEGVVGVDLIEKSHFWGSHVIEFFAVGTAVRPIHPDHVIERPQLMVPVDR
ncbi:MAG TPA: heavy metal-binding domain-containing protein [Acidimicrobiales bacterium]|nr:heavy metal-binding domain-containing protein [Acidimicrobiales bacterium]